MSEKYISVDGTNISIINNNGSVTLFFKCPIRNKRVKISLGLKFKNKTAIRIATKIALILYDDLILGNYDSTWIKYKCLANPSKYKETGKTVIDDDKLTEELTLKISLKNVWENYQKFKTVDYKLSSTRFLNKICDDRFIDDIPRIFSSLADKYSNYTLYRYLTILSSAINLAIKQGLYLGNNPLINILTTIKPKKKKKPDYYTAEEVRAILKEFSVSHDNYYNFIAFRFLTGCRPSEGIALTWNDLILIEGKPYINFHQRYINGRLIEGTKNKNDYRLFPLNEPLKELLKNCEITDKTNLIFYNHFNYSYINSHNFSNRIWKPTVKKLYDEGKINKILTFYDQRHTALNLLAHSGIDLKTISDLVGNSVEVLTKNYLSTNQDVEIPKLF